MQIAFVAHDEKKSALVEFVNEHIDLLAQYEGIATGSTGERLGQETDLEVEGLLSGSDGGDMMVGAAIAGG